jgi:formylmethanofuran dehydrogenase subunit E
MSITSPVHSQIVTWGRTNRQTDRGTDMYNEKYSDKFSNFSLRKRQNISNYKCNESLRRIFRKYVCRSCLKKGTFKTRISVTKSPRHVNLNTGWAYSLSLITNIYYKKTTWNTNFFFYCNSTQEVFLQHINRLQQKYVCIPCSFLVINVCNQGKTLCSPCITSVKKNIRLT